VLNDIHRFHSKPGIAMKRCLLFASALVAALLFSSFAIADDNVLTEDEKKDGWQLLFNGSDLTGWKCTSANRSQRRLRTDRLFRTNRVVTSSCTKNR
jgi:hypothetical protein